MVRAVMMAVAMLLASARSAAADPAERSDTARALHLTPFVAFGILYLALEFGLKERISAKECRWCESNAFDTAARGAFRWDNVDRAASISNVTGYLSAPLLGVGGLLASGLIERSDYDQKRAFDDVVPVLQAGVAMGMVNQTFKLIFARRRPFATFNARSTMLRKGDVNTSFFSGHTSLAFAMATSAGTVATLRDYRSAPYLWAGGIALGLATGYLRIAADAHYATDVVVGALVGTLVGVAVPLLFHRDVLTDEASAPRTAPQRRPVVFSMGRAF